MKFLQWLLYGAVVIQYVLYSLFVIAIIGIVIFLELVYCSSKIIT